jgi:hypothetical protein
MVINGYCNQIKVQLNLCIATTFGTGNKWSLFGGGRYSEVQMVKFIFLIKNFISISECRVFSMLCRKED